MSRRWNPGTIQKQRQWENTLPCCFHGIQIQNLTWSSTNSQFCLKSWKELLIRPAWDVEKPSIQEKVSWQPERSGGENPVHGQSASTFQIFLWIKVQNEFLGQIPMLEAMLSVCLEVPKLNPIHEQSSVLKPLSRHLMLHCLPWTFQLWLYCYL